MARPMPTMSGVDRMTNRTVLLKDSQNCESYQRPPSPGWIPRMPTKKTSNPIVETMAKRRVTEPWRCQYQTSGMSKSPRTRHSSSGARPQVISVPQNMRT